MRQFEMRQLGTESSTVLEMLKVSSCVLLLVRLLLIIVSNFSKDCQKEAWALHRNWCIKYEAEDEKAQQPRCVTIVKT
jgi:hypothetical protein